MDVQPVKRAGGYLVSKAFQSRAQKGATAVALVGEAQFEIQPRTVGLDACLQRFELARDRVGFGLLF